MYRTATELRVFRRGAGVALLFAAALAVIPTITSAADPVTRKVKVADLNLASPQGQLTLARRLRIAVDQVCAPDRGESKLRVSSQKIEDCRRTAWADAQRQLQQYGLPPLLAASR